MSIQAEKPARNWERCQTRSSI